MLMILFRKAVCFISRVLMYPYRKINYKKVRFSSKISFWSFIQNSKHVYLDKDTVIRGNVSVSGENFELGENSRIGYGCHIIGDVRIGRDVMIAPNCTLVSDYHGYKDKKIHMFFQKGISKGHVQIGDDVWIGANSVILSGVKISKGVIVGAGSIVTKNIGEYAIVAGNPAKVVGKR